MDSLPNHALVLYGATDLRLESRPIPAPKPDELLIRIEATGLCGSDLHYYHHGRNGSFVVQDPLVLGHEAAGVVVQTGDPDMNGTANGSSTHSSSSSGFKVGDRVVLEVGLPCRTCPTCTRGRYNLCPALRFKSSAKTYPHLDGTLQTYMTHPASLCYKLPDNMTMEEGALCEPLAVCLHAVNRSVTASEGLAGTSALVIGAGAVGMLTALALRVSGVSRITVADIDGPRLEICQNISNGRFGLQTYLIPRTTKSVDGIENELGAAQELAEKISAAAQLDSFDRVFECTGVPSCVQMGIYATTAGGKLVLVGMGSPVQTLPLGAAALREVDLVGVFRYAGEYPAAIQLFASGQLTGVGESLVSHRLKLQDGETAFRLAANRGSEEERAGRVAVKVMVVS